MAAFSPMWLKYVIQFFLVFMGIDFTNLMKWHFQINFVETNFREIDENSRNSQKLISKKINHYKRYFFRFLRYWNQNNDFHLTVPWSRSWLTTFNDHMREWTANFKHEKQWVLLLGHWSTIKVEMLKIKTKLIFWK